MKRKPTTAKKTTPKSVDAYISQFPSDVQQLLEKLRSTIRKAAPRAQEVISYGIPGFKMHGTIVHFAGYKKHIGLYPAPRGHEDFAEALAEYEGGKSTVQFPLDRPIPVGLVSRIVRFQVARDRLKAERKKSKNA